MPRRFWKYQSTGNDFIIFDVHDGNLEIDEDTSKQLCDRRFGIGSDGILCLAMVENALQVDFLNPDGSRSFCGNGSRAALRYANDMGWIKDEIDFLAIDGQHSGRVEPELVRISMTEKEAPRAIEGDHFIDTGSPHLVRMVQEVDSVDVEQVGAQLRYAERWNPGGVNVNFVQVIDEAHIKMRTYERGVEGETLSCGTGVTAAALVHAELTALDKGPIRVETRGGDLSLDFRHMGKAFQDVYLSGPSERVFEGWVEL